MFKMFNRAAATKNKKPSQRGVPAPVFPTVMPDKLYPADVALWPKQIQLVAAMLNDMEMQGYGLLKTGQRSGKSVMQMEIARDPRFKNVFMFEDSHEHSAHIPVPITYCTTKKIPRSLVEGNVEAPLIIMNEPFWMEDSFDLFNELRQYGPVLVMGSRGPQYDDARWQNLSGRSYNVWDINPNIKCEEVIPSPDSEDYERAVRDYAAF